jgi:DNA-directed RNA polymerase specialized sigma24 family protein
MDSIVRILDPDDLPWRGGHTFLVHMFSVVRQTWYPQRRRRRHEREIPDGREAQETMANDGELPKAVKPAIDWNAQEMIVVATARAAKQAATTAPATPEAAPRPWRRPATSEGAGDGQPIPVVADTRAA